jgi:hypothetical protein
MVWLVLRVFLAAQNSILGVQGHVLAILFPVSLIVMFAVGAVAALDVTLGRERVFLENLGLGRREIFLLSFLMAGALEGFAAILILAAGPDA